MSLRVRVAFRYLPVFFRSTWIFLLMVVWHQGHSQKTEAVLFAGSYTTGRPDTGIYVFSFNSVSGELKRISQLNGVINPSFLDLSGGKKIVYACTESKLPGKGSVSSFSLSDSFGLQLISSQKTRGENPVYVNESPDGRFLINANYTWASLDVYKINPAGTIGDLAQTFTFTGSSSNVQRQEQPHLHAAVFSPEGKFLFVPDLGSDRIRVFRYQGLLAQPLVPYPDLDVVSVPGSGPRHLEFHPSGQFAFCVEELSGCVSAYRYNNGTLEFVQRHNTYSQQLREYAAADIHISPDGLHLYVSNRGEKENTLAIFSIEKESGMVKKLGHVKTGGINPRNFCIHSSGRFLLVANQESGDIVVFKRDERTGLLSPSGFSAKVPNVSSLVISDL